MCGITGIVDFDGTHDFEHKVRAITRHLAHRGPDGEGYYFDRHIGLGHRRLSIIDIEGGRQPMCNEDKSLWIVYNGEVYNFPELKRELEQKGHYFSTRSDTEVILNAYEQWGVDCLNRFNGMFAFALWDSNRNELFLARDRIGVKPLVYTFEDNCLIFSSEVKALTAGLENKPEINSFGMFCYFMLQYVPGEDTILEGIRRLLPGEAAIYSREGLKKWRWWKLPESPPCQDNNAESRLMELLDDSVRMRLISDVPLGAFLSGGIDSSLVVGLMSRHAEGRVKTYQVAFDEPPGYDETPYAELASRRYETAHTRSVMNPSDLAELLPKIAARMGEPVADPALIPTYAISGLARREVAVALSGEGGDELFAGYLRYRLALYAKWWNIIPKFIRDAGRKFAGSLKNADRWVKAIDALNLSPGASGHFAWVRVLQSVELSGLFPDMDFKDHLEKLIGIFEPYFSDVDERGTLRATLDCDLNTWLPCDLLVKVDLMSMAHGLETRVPYLDYRLVEWAASLPAEKLLNRNEGKLILKRAAGSLVPEEIIKRGKWGFTLPLDYWFRGPLRDFLIEAVKLAGKFLPIDGKIAENWVDLELSGKRNFGLRLFAMCLLGYWLEGES